MLNPQAYFNSRPDGFPVLEIAEGTPDAPRRFVPLQRTELTGTVTGPLATLALIQTFSLTDDSGAVVEALYRFPLPGDAAVTGVRVKFGDIEIHTALKEREKAEEEYKEAKQSGRQAALVTRESPDVFTLAVAGIKAGQDVTVRTEYAQVAKPEGAGWALRVPLTTSPRYVRQDEANSRHAAGQPLAVLRDPGHRFALDVAFLDADSVSSNTHTLVVEDQRVRLRDGEVVPDRDCVLTWRAKTGDRPALRVWTHTDAASGKAYFLALCAPPKFAPAKKVPREVVLLVDHSGSMEGAKWEAADWAVERFLAGMSEQDSFALGLFHDDTTWFGQRTKKATGEAVRDAVKFLKANRSSGGTNLGVALEQALDRARTADTPARHVLVLTDAEVSDSGRILRLADAESARRDRRRISVLCIDSAPNEALASQLAERGGGVARFLTSNPDEDDVTTALDEVLADWSAPVLTGLTLEVNRSGVEAAGHTVAAITPGARSAIDIGDLPAGRPVWVIGRVQNEGEPLTFRLRTGAEVVAESRVDVKESVPGLKAIFGADRVRRLEYVMTANYAGEELRAELARIGYESPALGEPKVYAENAHESVAKVVRALLVQESLAAGVPSSETAFVAVRSEVGQPVTETRIVANALPHGWSPGFASGGMPMGGMAYACLSAAPAMGDTESVDSCLMEDVDTLSAAPPRPAPMTRQKSAPSALMGVVSRLRAAEPAPPPSQAATHDVRVAVKAGEHAPAHGAVLFDDMIGADGQFTFLSVTFADQQSRADTLDPELTLLLFVGDLAAPRAQVKLADVVRAGGRRPLNISRKAGQPVRLVLADPNGAWKEGVPAMEIVVG